MAKQPEAPPAEEIEEAPKPKKKSRLLLIIIILVLLGGGGFAGWYFMKAPPKKADGTEEAAQKAKPKLPPTFVPLETFTVNLADGNDHLLQVNVELKVADPKLGEQIKVHMPEIRNDILLLLSSKRVEELSNTQGKNKLSEEIRIKVNKILDISGPDQGVLGVFFVSFVMQ